MTESAVDPAGEEFEVAGLRLRLTDDFRFQFAATGTVTVVTADEDETFVANLFSFDATNGPHLYSNFRFADLFGRGELDRNGHGNRAALREVVRARVDRQIP